MKSQLSTEEHSQSVWTPFKWVPSLYFAEGIPYVIVMTIAVVMYKRLNLSNADIAFFTSWLYLPWVIKPFWSPIVDMFKSKRWWILIMQLVISTGMAGVAFTIPASNFFQWTMFFFWIMAFSSATHDIAADGFYMIGLSEHNQSNFVGIRSLFYRLAMITGNGLLIMLAGSLEVWTRNPVKAWSFTFWITTAVFLFLFLYHFFFLPHPEQDLAKEETSTKEMVPIFFQTFVSFFKKPQIAVAILFMLFFRFPEALLVKVCPLFLLDSIDAGGLALTTSELGFVQGTVGVIGLVMGGILGGLIVARFGLKRSLIPMVLFITVPDAVYIYLAYAQPDNFIIVNACIFIEQFGYGFGFTAYMMYLIFFSQGENKTAHYAFCTGFMALSMMLPGMFAGELQELVGYLNFFIIVMLLTPLTLVVSLMIKVDKDFGKKQ